MSRIATSDVTAALQRAAANITRAAGADGRTSRAELKASLPSLPRTEQQLTEAFFRFVDHRDSRRGAHVTKTDVERAVSHAREKLIEQYDLNRNGLSSAEVKAMSLTGRLAVELAKELKVANAGPIDKGAFLDRVKFVSDRALTSADLAAIGPALGRQIIAAFHEGELRDVTTLAEAFNSTDDGKIFVRDGADQKTGTKYVSVDYVAGGNVTGAIFRASSVKVKVSIQDGEFFLP